MIHRRESHNKKEEKKPKKYNFQGQSARSRRWFDLDHEWLEYSFSTREPDLYKNCIELNLGVMIQKYFKYLDYQLVMQK